MKEVRDGRTNDFQGLALWRAAAAVAERVGCAVGPGTAAVRLRRHRHDRSPSGLPRLAAALGKLDCYLSMDIEDGYADDPEQVAHYVGQLRVDGINIEDSTTGKLIDPQQHAAKLQAIKQHSPDVFINARVDTYWLGQDATVDQTLGRAAHYVDAGADAIFVPGATEPDVLRELTAAIPLPLNVLAVPGRSLAELAGMGVRRVSTGSLPYRVAIHAAAQAAVAVRDATELPAADTYPEMQDRLVRYANQKFSG
jgi:2-methylisocitrate lyase-like PEP mutase family enzyme